MAGTIAGLPFWELAFDEDGDAVVVFAAALL